VGELGLGSEAEASGDGVGLRCKRLRRNDEASVAEQAEPACPSMHQHRKTHTEPAHPSMHQHRKALAPKTKKTKPAKWGDWGLGSEAEASGDDVGLRCKRLPGNGEASDDLFSEILNMQFFPAQKIPRNSANPASAEPALLSPDYSGYT